MDDLHRAISMQFALTMLFVFVVERTTRIEVRYGLEGALTDGQAHQILGAQESRFAPSEYQDGIDGTLLAIFQAISSCG